MAHYTGTTDLNIIRDQILNSGLIFVQKLEYSGVGTYATATEDFTFTDSSFAVDGLISQANNITVLVGGIPYVTKVTDNDSTSVTIDASALLSEADGTSIASLTDASTYSVKVYSATTTSDYSSGAYGKFLGTINETFEVSNAQEIAYSTSGVPRNRIDSGLTSNIWECNFILYQLANADLLKAVFNMGEYGSQTSQTKLASGSNPAADTKYKFKFLTQDRDGNTVLLTFRSVVFRSNGAINFEEQDFKSFPIMLDIFADSFYPQAYDTVDYIRAS